MVIKALLSMFSVGILVQALTTTVMQWRQTE